MEPLLRSLGGFATLLDTLDEELFASLVQGIGHSILEVVAQQPAAGGRSAEAIVRMAEQSRQDDLPLWCPELGLCLSALKAALKNGDIADGQVGLAQVALNLASAGVPGSVTITFAQPCRLRWRHLILAPARRMAMRADGTQVHLEIESDQHTRAVTWSIEAPNPDLPVEHRLVRVQSGSFDAMLLSGPNCRELRLPQPVPMGVEAIAPAQRDQFHVGLDLFANAPASWRQWFTRVIRAVSLGQMPSAGFCSGSFDGYYGLISMSDVTDPLKIAETLVHESAHQYFFVINRVAPVARESDAEYYSPFVRRKRPIGRILMGYHAFVNVEIFYQHCLAEERSPAQCRSVLAQIGRELSMVEPVLAENADLTSVGRALFERLVAVRPVHAGTH